MSSIRPRGPGSTEADGTGMNEFQTTLRSAIDRIIPEDDFPGALQLGTDKFVIERLAAEPRVSEAVVAGLAALDTRARQVSNQSFAALPPERRDGLLQEVEGEPWFARLVTLVSEGFYADPDNGGNAGARSWAMIGYEHRLPDGPSGPPGRGAASGTAR